MAGKTCIFGKNEEKVKITKENYKKESFFRIIAS